MERQEMVRELLSRGASVEGMADSCKPGDGDCAIVLPSTALVAYDPSSNMPEMELLGCESTRTPGTAQTGKQKPP
jgi:hypothetical protein